MEDNMYFEIGGEIPIYSWINPAYIEAGALAQAQNAASHPHTSLRIVLLPDVHQGYGVPIGSVAAFKDHICPANVGYDIGCGMVAVRTSIRPDELDRDTLTDGIMSGIRKHIPMGVGGRAHNKLGFLPPHIYRNKTPIAESQSSSLMKQLGTLGGGNHFIEIQRGSDGYVWAMIHSGSRNVGWKVADHYMKLAKSLNEQSEHTDVLPWWQLETLHVDSDEGQAYLREMNWCMLFAKINRKVMIEIVKEVIREVVPNTIYDREIEIAHNFAALEEHEGKNLWIHRKGATQAGAGQLGIIPGAQGCFSYIVEGLGNPASFNSCSHGAGRNMSRSKAKKELDFAEETKRMEDAGVVHAIRSKKDLDEAAGAYKDIETVMARQKDLVKIDTELFTMGVLKGNSSSRKNKR